MSYHARADPSETLHERIIDEVEVQESTDAIPEVREREQRAGEKACEVIALLRERHPGLEGEWSFRAGGTVEIARWRNSEELFSASFAYSWFEKNDPGEIAGAVAVQEISSLRCTGEHLLKIVKRLSKDNQDLVRLVQEELEAQKGRSKVLEGAGYRRSALRDLEIALEEKESAFRIRSWS